MHINDFAVIQDLQQRIAVYEDMKAYKQLYELLYNSLFKFSYSFVKSREVAEEIVSDVFIKLWAIRTDLNAVNNLKVYLFTITKNFSLNYITRHNKLKVVSLEDFQTQSFFNYSSPENLFVSKELVARINAAINSLPGQCRIIFHMSKEAGLKYQEIADILNISPNTVRNQVAIATKKVAEALPLSLQQQFATIKKFSDS